MEQVDIVSAVTRIDSIIEEKAVEFNNYARKSLESVLEMCRVIVEAKDELNDEADFNRFAQRIGCEGSYLRKCTIIGRRYNPLCQDSCRVY